MSELAQRLLPVVQGGPVTLLEAWCHLLDDTSFDEVYEAMNELMDAGLAVKMDDRYVARAA